MLVPSSGPRSYMDLVTNTPYRARSDIKLILHSGGETIIPTGTVFYLFPDMGSGKGVYVLFSRDWNDPRNIRVDQNCKGIQELDVEEA